jgi:hypothetical protein
MRPIAKLFLASLAPLGALLLAGCATEFTPASVVEDLRVLAIVAEPPELRLDPVAGTNVLTVLTVTAVAPPATPAGPPLTPAPADVSWTFCPFSVGATSGYACAIPACESTLPHSPDGRVATLDPLVEVMKPACQAALAGLGAGAPGGIGGGGSVETLVRYVATLGGLRREAVQRIPVWFSTPPVQAANLNPVITSTKAGPDCSTSPSPCSVSAVSIDVAIDPSSFQPYAVGERTVDETIVVNFFTTAGRFKYPSGQATSAAPATSALLEAKELGGATEALVWVVARDLRGGEAVAGPLTVVFSRP